MPALNFIEYLFFVKISEITGLLKFESAQKQGSKKAFSRQFFSNRDLFVLNSSQSVILGIIE
jgi:hypothetical protein